MSSMSREQELRILVELYRLALETHLRRKREAANTRHRTRAGNTR